MRQRYKRVPLQTLVSSANANVSAVAMQRSRAPASGFKQCSRLLCGMFARAEPCSRGASCCRVFAAKRAFPCLSVGLPSSVHADMPQLVARQAQANRGDLWTALQALHSIYEVGGLHKLSSCHVTSAMAYGTAGTAHYKPAKLFLQGAASALPAAA